MARGNNERRGPVGRITATNKKDREEKIKIGAVWPTQFPDSYNVSFGDRDTNLDEVLEIIESGDYYINLRIYEDSNDGF